MSQTNQKLPTSVIKKNRWKVFRTVLQVIFCLVIVCIVVKIVYFSPIYMASDKSAWTNKEGFLTLSYVGVSRNESAYLVSKKKLDEHLGALHEAGYVTIDIEDVLNFYNEGTPLPEKAMLLIFEDGRKDSFLFAQPILEKYNYKAVMMTYAYNVINNDRLFLKSRDLEKMKKSTYWDIGSNGYRFSYINVMPKDTSIEDTDSDEKFQKNLFEYNHYLMDYLRDQDGIPVESKLEMIDRITWDYDQMNEIYTEKLTFPVQAYAIMHANSLVNESMNGAVADVNLQKIHEYFPLLFNREGSCYNDEKTSIYNLTRMQVGADWSTNKLLMEIKNWTTHDVPYVVGDDESRWDVVSGVLEANENHLILTTESNSKALAFLKGSDQFEDVHVSTYLAGREFGTQSFYVRYNREQDTYVQLIVENNELTVIQKKGDGTKEILYEAPLPNFEQLPEYDDTFDINKIEGSQSDEPTLEGIDLIQQLHRKYKVNASHMMSPVSWNFDVIIEGQSLTVTVGGEVILDGFILDESVTDGGVAISSSDTSSEVYDGIFDELRIEPILVEKK